MFTSLAILCLTLAGLLLIVGWKRGAFRLGILGLAIGALSHLLNSHFQNLAQNTQRHFGFILGLGFLLIIGLGFLRFVYHRRQIGNWFGQRPTSTKRRIDRR